MKKRSNIGKRIKRTFIFILILAAAGAVFYFGFYQFQLPADNYGVIFTKYTGSGWDMEVLQPGSLRFVWQGLLPMNLSIERFSLTPARSRIEIGGNLPSSDIYSIYLEGSPDFNYSYTFDITYTIRPDKLAELVTEDFLRKDNYDSWLADLENELSADAVSFIRLKADDIEYMNRIAYNYRLMETDLIDHLSETYDYLDIISFIPADINFPDLSLYVEGRRQYFEFEELHNEVEQASISKTTDRIAEENAKLELLEKYGALFAKYPQLIDYYSIFNKESEELLPYIELPDIINNED